MASKEIDAEEERLDNLVDQWHQGGGGASLREFLGMTVEQYHHWLKDPDDYLQAATRPAAPTL